MRSHWLLFRTRERTTNPNIDFHQYRYDTCPCPSRLARTCAKAGMTGPPPPNPDPVPEMQGFCQVFHKDAPLLSFLCDLIWFLLRTKLKASFFHLLTTNNIYRSSCADSTHHYINTNRSPSQIPRCLDLVWHSLRPPMIKSNNQQMTPSRPSSNAMTTKATLNSPTIKVALPTSFSREAPVLWQ